VRVGARVGRRKEAAKLGHRFCRGRREDTLLPHENSSTARSKPANTTPHGQLYKRRPRGPASRRRIRLFSLVMRRVVRGVAGQGNLDDDGPSHGHPATAYLYHSVTAPRRLPSLIMDEEESFRCLLWSRDTSDTRSAILRRLPSPSGCLLSSFRPCTMKFPPSSECVMWLAQVNLTSAEHPQIAARAPRSDRNSRPSSMATGRQILGDATKGHRGGLKVLYQTLPSNSYIKG
jgi:hypothetical protein